MISSDMATAIVCSDSSPVRLRTQPRYLHTAAHWELGAEGIPRMHEQRELVELWRLTQDIERFGSDLVARGCDAQAVIAFVQALCQRLSIIDY